jgi:hypothetical protein
LKTKKGLVGQYGKFNIHAGVSVADDTLEYLAPEAGFVAIPLEFPW